MICTESVQHFAWSVGTFHPAVLFIDEALTVALSFSRGTIKPGDEAACAVQALRSLLQNVPVIVLADACLSQPVRDDFVREIRRNSKPSARPRHMAITHPFVRQCRRVDLFGRVLPVVRSEARRRIVERILALRRSGVTAPVAVYTGRRDEADAMQKDLLQKWPELRIKVVHGETPVEERVRLAAGGWKEYDVVIYNGAMCEGVDFSGKDFAAIFAVCHIMSLTATSILQGIGRARTIRAPAGASADVYLFLARDRLGKPEQDAVEFLRKARGASGRFVPLAWPARVDAVVSTLIDVGGCVVRDGEALPGGEEVLKWLEEDQRARLRRLPPKPKEKSERKAWKARCSEAKQLKLDVLAGFLECGQEVKQKISKQRPPLRAVAARLKKAYQERSYLCHKTDIIEELLRNIDCD